MSDDVALAPIHADSNPNRFKHAKLGISGGMLLGRVWAAAQSFYEAKHNCNAINWGSKKMKIKKGDAADKTLRRQLLLFSLLPRNQSLCSAR